MGHHLPGVAAFLDQRGNQCLGLRRHADVDGLRRDAEHGLGPGPAAVPVGDHLALVDDGDVVEPLFRHHFDRRGHVHRAGDQPFLLAGDHAARDAVAVHALGLLHRQQAQRREVDPGFGLFTVGDRLVGLAGVGRPDVEHEVPLDAARHREELGDVLGDLLLDQLPLPRAVLDEWVVAVVFEQIDGLAQRNLRRREPLAPIEGFVQPLFDVLGNVDPIPPLGDVAGQAVELGIGLGEALAQLLHRQRVVLEMKVIVGRLAAFGPSTQVKFDLRRNFLIAVALFRVKPLTDELLSEHVRGDMRGVLVRRPDRIPHQLLPS